MEYVNAKHLVIKTKSAHWFGTDYNMNIYRGCCHGCIYCDSRSDCYGIENFNSVKAKQDALRIIRDDLRRKVKKGVVGTGAMSDPYNPHEEKLLLTRKSLELINSFAFGVGIATKSTLITRDVDILCDINTHSPVIAKITITSADDDLGKKVEPHAPKSSDRFEAVARLTESGIFTGILLMPTLPFIEDTEENVRQIVERAHDSGAKFIYAGFGVTLRDGQREYFYKKLDEIFPGIKEKYISRYRNSYLCTSPKAKRLWEVFSSECDKYGILYNMKSIIHRYKTAYKGCQMSLFDL